MVWTPVSFGNKYKGKTLPQILFSDPAWFFVAIEKDTFKDTGMIAEEAVVLNRRARHIKIPLRYGAVRIEYTSHKGKFYSIDLRNFDNSTYGETSSTILYDVIDLSKAGEIALYDNLGCKRMLEDIKDILFGSKKYIMDKKRCEDFFANEDNFTVK